MKTYCSEELSKANGQDGSQTLVAVNGQVYDLTGSKKWAGGRHMNRHCAGADLTADIKSAPHGVDVLERFERVGFLQDEAQPAAAGLKGQVAAWLDRRPFFKRHPHPAAAHLPVGVIMAALLFELIALASGSARTEWAAFCCLLLVLVSIPAAMASGYFTWWVNYECASHRIIAWKRRLAWLALAVAALSALTRLFAADFLDVSDGRVILYVASVLALTVLISAIGFLGGKLTFPYE
jgi:predicted heme/steroid binding protein/uncharacterized membrane protein